MKNQDNPTSSTYLQRDELEDLPEFKIWLSRNPEHYGLYLTQHGSQLVIGSRQGDHNTDVLIKVHDLIGFTEKDVDEDWKKITLNVFSQKKKTLKNIRRSMTHFTIYIYTPEYSKSRMDQLIGKLKTLSTNTEHEGRQPSKKRMMIYFNPCSGSNSKKYFDRVVDFLKLTCCEYDVLTTERRHHCKQHIDNELIMENYTTIVIISGDGLMHQFVNSKAAGVIPVTHVPAGSGNAFAKYQMTLAGQACQAQEAIFLAIKGKIKNLNLTEFQLQKIQNPIFSFLSFEWCFMADIDMNSQFLRCLGGLRFQAYGIWRLLALRKYRGKFSYSLHTTDIPPLDTEITDNESFKTQQKNYLHKIITFIPWISDNYEISPLLQIEDQAMDLQSIAESVGRMKLIKYMLNCESGQHFDRQNKTIQRGYDFDWKKIKSFRLQPNGADRGVFGIDGQRYESQKIQGKISDRKVSTFI